MSDNNIEARVKKIVVEHLGVEEDKVTKEASFIDDLAPTASIRLSSSWRSRRSSASRFPDDAAETILTVGDAVRFLEKSTS